MQLYSPVIIQDARREIIGSLWANGLFVRIEVNVIDDRPDTSIELTAL